MWLIGFDLSYILNKSDNNNNKNHSVKSVRIQSYSGPHFPAFWPNTERYNVLLYSVRMRENLTRITPNTDTFHAVYKNKNFASNLILRQVFRMFNENINFSTEFQYCITLKTIIYYWLFLIALYFPKNENKHPFEMRS